ncbi:hypothetical protein, partial [Streptomyces nanshensis]
VRHHGSGAVSAFARRGAAHRRQNLRPGAFGVPQAGHGSPSIASSVSTGRTTGRRATGLAGWTAPMGASSGG